MIGSLVPLAIRQEHDIPEHSTFAQHELQLSGDRAMPPTLFAEKTNRLPSGGVIWRRNTRSSAAGWRKCEIPQPPKCAHQQSKRSDPMPAAVGLGHGCWRLLHRPDERCLQIARGLKPLIRILRQRAPHHAFQRWRHRERRRLPFQNRRDHAGRALAFERPLAREHLVQHAAEAEQIAARIRLLALQLLRRHVLQRPDNLPFRRQRLRQSGVGFLERSSLLGQAEVEQLDALFRDQDVGRLQIAMGDALAVRRIQRVQNLAGIFDGLSIGNGPLSGAPSMNSITR